MEKQTGLIFFFFFLIFLTSLLSQEISKEQFTVPAEFEKTDAIWLNWNTYSFYTEGEPERILLEMIKSITPHAEVNLIVSNDIVKSTAIHSMVSFGADTSRVNFFYYNSRKRWLRDLGPFFLYNSTGLKIADYNYNCYGYCQPYSEDAREGNLDSTIAVQVNLPVIKSNINGEWGGKEFNGKGTMIVVESVELDRNLGMTKQQLEEEFKHTLGVKKIIWLKSGLVEDQIGALSGGFYALGTGGHIDEFCRFVDSNTVLLAQVSPRERDADALMKINYRRLEENYNILKSATDQGGKLFNIIRIPTANFIVDAFVANENDIELFPGTAIGDTVKALAVTSYLNFIIVNDLVLIPKYYRDGLLPSTKEKDFTALIIFKKIFPGKEILQIDVTELNYGGGGMHCLTQHQPVIN